MPRDNNCRPELPWIAGVAPQHPRPAGLDGCYAALSWLARRPDEERPRHRRRHRDRTIAAAILLAASAFGVSGTTSPARATTKEDVELNGTYRATSIGNLAKVNDQYNDEPTVTAVWTITSTCTTFQECAGTVTSDQGWSAPLYTHDGNLWYVKHDVPNWERCPDGTAYTGQQTYTFYPVDGSNGQPQLGSATLAGLDRTVGPSGACGQNKWLDIELPLRMQKLG